MLMPLSRSSKRVSVYLTYELLALIFPVPYLLEDINVIRVSLVNQGLHKACLTVMQVSHDSHTTEQMRMMHHLKHVPSRGVR